MNDFKNKFQKNPFYVIVSKPSLYLKVLLWHTFLIGLFTLLVSLAVKGLHYENFSIPSSMHSLIGIVIGLLLVFRTNTAYDRWWDGRKIISNLSSEIGMITSRVSALQSKDKNSIMFKYDIGEHFLKNISDFLTNLHDYLVKTDDDVESTNFHLSQNKIIKKALINLDGFDESNHNVSQIHNSLNKLLEHSNNLERIKNTPIPLAYVLHIKMSILIYLTTLPFGMFHELGLWATPLVMLVYYIIAGVEIISNEIENPFANDPNDLPTSQLFDDMLKTIKDY